MGGKIKMIEETMYCEEVFKGSYNQVLVHVPNNGNMITSVLLRQLIVVGLQERNGLATVPLWAATHTARWYDVEPKS